MAIREYKSEEEAPNDEASIEAYEDIARVSEALDEDELLDQHGFKTFDATPFDQDGNPVWAEGE